MLTGSGRAADGPRSVPVPPLRARNSVDPLARQDERGTARRMLGHRRGVAATLDHALDDPHLEGVVEAIPDVPVAHLVAAQASHEFSPPSPRDRLLPRGLW